jgi:hypothetical protein
MNICFLRYKSLALFHAVDTVHYLAAGLLYIIVDGCLAMPGISALL